MSVTHLPTPEHVNAMRQRKAAERSRARKRRQHAIERKAS